MTKLLSFSSASMPCVDADLWSRAENVLSRNEYAALQLRYAENQDVAGVAESLSFSRFYVRILLFRARKKLLRTV